MSISVKMPNIETILGLVTAGLLAILIGLLPTAAYAAEPCQYDYELEWGGSSGSGSGLFSTDRGFVVDSQGNQFFLDYYIQKLDNYGMFIDEWVPFTDFNYQEAALAIDSNDVLYAVAYNDSGDPSAPSVIRKYDTDGNFIEELGTLGTELGSLSYPSSISVDSSGDIYTLDYDSISGEPRIQKFDSSGNFIGTVGSFGYGTGQYGSLTFAITTDSLDNLYVVDIDSSRIIKFDSSGNYLTDWPSINNHLVEIEVPVGIFVDDKGHVFVSSVDDYQVLEYDENGVLVSQIGIPGGGTGPSEFDAPAHIAIDSQGSLFVVDPLNYRVQKFSADCPEPLTPPTEPTDPTDSNGVIGDGDEKTNEDSNGVIGTGAENLEETGASLQIASVITGVSLTIASTALIKRTKRPYRAQS